MMSPAFLACVALVSSFYQLPPRVLPSIHAVEGGRPGMVSGNSNGSADLGVMQINTLWVPELARHTRQPEDIVRHRLTHDECFGIAAAGAILRIQLDREKGDLMRAIGNYHSRTPALNRAYGARVLRAAHRLYTPGGAHSQR
ncbi:MAG: lytic transglycosylase domain-containing protein [Sneathiellaceae bacterium]